MKKLKQIGEKLFEVIHIYVKMRELVEVIFQFHSRNPEQRVLDIVNENLRIEEMNS